MLDVIDIQQRLDNLPFLKNRTRHTTEEQESAAFARMGSTAGGEIYAGSFSGQSAWENHVGDEIVQVFNGETDFELIGSEGHEHHTLHKGMMIIVPAGCWHRFHSANGVSLLTVTPLPTKTSTAENPVAD